MYLAHPMVMSSMKSKKYEYIVAMTYAIRDILQVIMHMQGREDRVELGA